MKKRLAPDINIFYLDLSSKELSALYAGNDIEDKEDCLWRHPKGDFITDAGVALIRKMRKKKVK